MDYIQSTFSEAIFGVAQSVMILVGVLILFLITRLIKKAGIEMDEQQVRQIKSIIDDVVVYANQMFVEKYKNESKDGKLTDEQKDNAFRFTKDIVEGSLTAEQYDVLKKRFGGSVESTLKLLIEKSVHDNKTVVSEISTTEKEKVQ